MILAAVLIIKKSESEIMNRKILYWVLLPILAVALVIISLRFASVFILLALVLCAFSFVAYKIIKSIKGKGSV
jgi:hypothetical protein